MIKREMKNILFILTLLVTISIKADVVLPAIISDNMILQQNTEVNIWGKADINEKIEISTSWDEKKYLTQADTCGKWLLRIQTPTKTNLEQKLIIKGKNIVEVRNILIGEVWICSGQSNMDFQVSKGEGWRTGVIDEKKEMLDATFSDIRLFHVEQKLSPEQELDDCEGEWLVCNPENLKTFSAVAFFFGKELYKKIKVPIGLIQSTWGGTHVESWTKMSEMEHDPVYADLVYDFYRSRDSFEADLINYEEQLKAYEIKKEAKKENIQKPKKPKGINHNKALSTLWNAMINPLLPYTIKGVIWYQGESNSIRHQDYKYVFTKMINSWRKEWGQGNFPFYFVQIAPHYKQPPHIREAQLETWQSVDNTGMVVITDAADSTDIHPRHKQIPGERLARWALAKTYGQNVPYSGPVYRSHEVEEHRVIITFDYVDEGLCSSDGKKLKGFTLAGPDKKFYPATAIIDGDKVVLTAHEVPFPMAIRYNWENFFRANFYNKAKLPASPFRTDRWMDN